MLLGAVLGGVPAAGASVGFVRTDVALPAAPDSVAIGDLDGVKGKDIVVGLWSPGKVGVMLNQGDGTFGAMVQYSAGTECAGLLQDVTLGDVTPLAPDGKLDAYVACTPNVVRLTGDGAGALGNPLPINMNLPPYLGAGTQDMLTLMRRPDANPAPLLVLQHAVGSFGRELCISYDLDPEALVCEPDTPVQEPLVVGDLNGSVAGVPPDEIVTARGNTAMNIFGFAPALPLDWSASTRPVPDGMESVALGDLDRDADLDVLVGQQINSVDARVNSIHYYRLNPSGSGGLESVGRPLPTTPGVDAVAVADVDGDACNDVIAAGTYGKGMVHLGDGALGFDGGRDLPQLAATTTRVSMAVGDLSGDGRPEVVIADKVNAAVMVYRNTSSPAGAPCFNASPTARNDVATVAQNAALTTINVLANDTDPDGGPKLVASVTPPAHGTAAIGGGGVRYKPATGYCNDLGPARDSFSYKLNGGSSATVTVTVECVDTAPPAGGGPSLPPPPPPPPPLPPPPPPRTCTAPGTTPFSVGTPGDDVLVGSNGRNVLSGRGGDDCLFGRANDDRLTGGTGDDLLDGGSGGDRINGDAGKDKIRAGRGNDDITPGAGQDTVAAQGGNDEIFARDSTRDTIDCGAGVDKVKADRSDSVKNCEYVKRPVRRVRRR